MVKSFDWLQLLQRHPVLSSLDENHAQWLLGDVTIERRYDPGAVIFDQGSEGDSVFLIGSGSAEAVFEAPGHAYTRELMAAVPSADRVRAD